MAILSQEEKEEECPSEFVYLNEVSLAHYLSSLGRGVPKQGSSTETEGTQKEAIGRFSANPSGLFELIKGSLEGRYQSLDEKTIETSVRYAAPYQFYELKNILEKGGNYQSETETESDTELSRGQIVECSGTIKPMSAFKFDLIYREILGISPNEPTESYLDDLCEFIIDDLYDEYYDVWNKWDVETNNQNSSSSKGSILQASNDMDENEASGNPDKDAKDQFGTQLFNWKEYPERTKRLINDFTSERLPIQLTTDSNGIAGFVLDRSHMRVNPVRTFSDPQEFTVFGKVEKILSKGEPWDPTMLTKTFSGYEPEPADPKSGFTSLRDWLDYFKDKKSYNVTTTSQSDTGIKVEKNDILIEGPAYILHPIAIYW